MTRVIVVGGGAAGMMAAIAAAEAGAAVTLYEKNEKLGKKLYITGKGRCNVTNCSDMETVFGNIVRNPRFLYSSFHQCQNYDVMNLFAEWGLALKVERGERVFPESDKSSDVIRALQRQLQKRNVRICLQQEIKGLYRENGRCSGVVTAENQCVKADAVIVCTGGLSYPSTGSTGDGYRFAAEAGHTIEKQTPGLVPLNVQESWCRQMQGLALKNVSLSVCAGPKEIYSGFGEMLFTHFGISGPLVLSASSYLRDAGTGGVTAHIDLKPALSERQLDDRLLREFEQFHGKQFKNALVHLFPSGLIPVMVEYSGIPGEKKVSELTRADRECLIGKMKNFVLHVTGPREYREAIITQGGVSTKEVNPSTMESKCLRGLYFAGEVLDVDALTGGFNLQIAWSTGWAAGNAAGKFRAAGPVGNEGME